MATIDDQLKEIQEDIRKFKIVNPDWMTNGSGLLEKLFEKENLLLKIQLQSAAVAAREDSGEIKFNVEKIQEKLDKDVAIWLQRAIVIAQRFVNLPSAKKAYEDLNVDLSALTNQAINVGFVFSQPTKKGQALAWIYKTDLNIIYLNNKFNFRLTNLLLKCGQNARASDDIRNQALKEVSNIVFAMSMCIVHEFAHIAFQLQAHPAPSIDSLLTTEQKSPKTSKNDAVVHVTPEKFKEAGRYMERKLFFNKILGLVCKPEKSFNKQNPPQWSNEMKVIGICQDNCPHDEYICVTCNFSGATKDQCLKMNHSLPKCKVCSSKERYQLINKLYIKRVFEAVELMNDDQLQSQDDIETTTTLTNDFIIYSLSPNEIDDYNDDNHDNNDSDDDDLRISDEAIIVSLCGP